MKKLAAGGVAIIALALGLSACGAPPASTGGASTAPSAATSAPASTAPGAANFKACLVSDTGGFNDKSFNEAAKQGVDQAVAQLGITSDEIESKTTADYATNITNLLANNCSVIIATGFNLETAMVSAAQASPNSHFAIVDDNPAKKQPNLKPIVFKTSEAGFLAGYAAAAYSKTGKVGTWGGMQIPTVTIFMDGFADGVAQYNTDYSKNVQVLGWDKTKQSGSFINSFTDQSLGQSMTTNLMTQGADVIMPVAGNAGMGAATVVQAKASSGAALVWVDQDGFVSMPQYGDILLTSVMKGIQSAVYNMIDQEVTQGSFDATPYVGTLANQGVQIAPFHNFSSKLPADVQTKITDLQNQIVSGSLKITSPADSALS